MPRFFENVRPRETFYTPSGVAFIKVKPTAACLVADNAVLHSFAPADVTLSEEEYTRLEVGAVTLAQLINPPAMLLPGPEPVLEVLSQDDAPLRGVADDSVTVDEIVPAPAPPVPPAPAPAPVAPAAPHHRKRGR